LYKGKKVYIASKALFTAARLERGYWDLADIVSPTILSLFKLSV